LVFTEIKLYFVSYNYINLIDKITMSGNIIRKILIIFIFITPAVSYTGCKKQARCGCGKDVVLTLANEALDYSQMYYNQDGTTATFSIGYSTYVFCNPVEMYPKYKTFRQGDQILISGDAFWECNYLYNSSNNSYQSYMKVYNIQVTDLKVYLYGKK
jgi:hypothetical protein